MTSEAQGNGEDRALPDSDILPSRQVEQEVFVTIDAPFIPLGETASAANDEEVEKAIIERLPVVNVGFPNQYRFSESERNFILSALRQHRGPIDRESGGKLVRETWIAWSKEQPNPKPSWLVSWEELSEPDKEVDRRIWEACQHRGQPQALNARQWLLSGGGGFEGGEDGLRASTFSGEGLIEMLEAFAQDLHQGQPPQEWRDLGKSETPSCGDRCEIIEGAWAVWESGDSVKSLFQGNRWQRKSLQPSQPNDSYLDDDFHCEGPCPFFIWSSGEEKEE